MKIKHLTDHLQNETQKLNFKMSSKLVSTPIEKQTSQTTCAEKTKLKLFPALLSVCCCLLVFCLCLPLFFEEKTQSNSQLTSYIIKINPSFCITTNENNEVVNICALNDDADSILSNEAFDSIIGSTFSDCVSLLINNVDSSIFENYNGSRISLYAINDDKTITDEKLNQFGSLVRENLDRRGFENIEFDKYDMSVDFFRKEMGIDGEFENLDDMQKAIENHPRFYDITRFSQKK